MSEIIKNLASVTCIVAAAVLVSSGSDAEVWVAFFIGGIYLAPSQ